jgi:putative transcriptional regulator
MMPRPQAPLRIEPGHFLVASPNLDTPLFERAVALLCEHTAAGSFALLINKPIEVELPEEMLDLEGASNEKVSLRAGGPLRPEQLMLLHNGQIPHDHCLPLLPGVVLGGDLPFLQQLLECSDHPPALLCFGYCSWGPGQLERELMEGEWHLVRGSAEDLFESDPHQLWAQMLRRHGGRIATLATLPADLSLN